MATKSPFQHPAKIVASREYSPLPRILNTPRDIRVLVEGFERKHEQLAQYQAGTFLHGGDLGFDPLHLRLAHVPCPTLLARMRIVARRLRKQSGRDARSVAVSNARLPKQGCRAID